MASAETHRVGVSSTDAPRSLAHKAPRVLSPEERQRLLLENLAEVHQVARRIHVRLPRHVLINDLIQEGVVGLIDAVEKYDPAKNVRLRSYARFRIRGAILDSLRELDWGPRQLRRQARRIDQAKRELACLLGRAPSEPEVAAHLGMPLEEFQRILSEMRRLSIETIDALPQLRSNQSVFIGRPYHTLEDPFDVCVRAETTRTLERAIDTLDQKSRRAVTLYYFEERTMKDIGSVLSVQESRVSQIISASLKRLRELMQNQNTRAGAALRRRRSCDRQRRASHRRRQRRHALGCVSSAVREA